MQPADIEKTTIVVGTPTVSFRPRKDLYEVSILYRQYEGEQDLPLIMALVDNELSEPYSIFTYRYFLHTWPQFCWLVFDGDHCFGTVVSKQDKHGELVRGYIAMLVVESAYRGLGVGTELVKRSIQEMIDDKADEVVLEAEVTNKGALTLYQNLGFIRDKYLTRYYLSGSDAFRLKLMLPLPSEKLQELQDEQLVAEELARMRLEAESSKTKGGEHTESDGVGSLGEAASEGALEVVGKRAEAPLQKSGDGRDSVAARSLKDLASPGKTSAKSKKTKLTKLTKQ